MSGERGNKAHSGKAVLDQGSLKSFILERVRVSRIPVKMQDHRRLLDSLGFHYIKVEWITPSPLYPNQFHGIRRMFIDHNERSNRLKMAGAQSGRSPVFGDALKTSVGGIGYRWRCRRLCVAVPPPREASDPQSTR